MLGLIAFALVAVAFLLVATLALMDKNDRKAQTSCEWCRMRVLRIEPHGSETAGTVEQALFLLDAPHNN